MRMTQATVTSPTGSSVASDGRAWPRVVVVGNPDGRRVTLFREVMAGLGAGELRVVSSADLLAGRVRLASFVEEGSVLRIESPDRDFAVERALIAAGADEPDDVVGASRIGREEAMRLEFDRGRILYPRQWFLGFRAFLRTIERQRAECPPHRLMNATDAIAVMFDKPHCHARFEASGLPCPRGLGTPEDYDVLRQRMHEAGLRRVFVKLAHGSSASGVVAFQTDGRRVQAHSTAEMERSGGELKLYNTRAIRRYKSEPEIATLIDALCRERVQAEQWVPKASLPGGAFDLRVVVIGGEARHIVARVSKTPITNLHLLNERADPERVRERMVRANWEAALHTCEQAAGLFPGCLYAGVDLVIAAGFRRHAVLEINAFGDLLPGITSVGLETYAAEMVALQSQAGEAP